VEIDGYQWTADPSEGSSGGGAIEVNGASIAKFKLCKLTGTDVDNDYNMLAIEGGSTISAVQLSDCSADNPYYGMQIIQSSSVGLLQASDCSVTKSTGGTWLHNDGSGTLTRAGGMISVPSAWSSTTYLTADGFACNRSGLVSLHYVLTSGSATLGHPLISGLNCWAAPNGGEALALSGVPVITYSGTVATIQSSVGTTDTGSGTLFISPQP
jgi:hypothetical protein